MFEYVVKVKAFCRDRSDRDMIILGCYDNEIFHGGSLQKLYRTTLPKAGCRWRSRGEMVFNPPRMGLRELQ